MELKLVEMMHSHGGISLANFRQGKGSGNLKTRISLSAGFIAVAALMLTASVAYATGVHEISLKPSKTKPYTACPPHNGKLDEANCNIVIEPRPTRNSAGRLIAADGTPQEGTGVLGGWAPADLQDAYNIPTGSGENQTVAVIDAYGDLQAESDLAVYREKYGLSPCTKANGCFRKVNQSGLEYNYPPTAPETFWGLETSLDLDMVSAACPKCHILLVQAKTENPADMAAAVNTAVKLGATEISNSYGYPERYQPWCPEEKGCAEYGEAYDHPGISITVASGDYGYENRYSGFPKEISEQIAGAPDWPAASPDVIAVGGTELEKEPESARGWLEQSWVYSGSGCSLHQPKPAWQFDSKCANRMGNDVSAVARNLSVYSTPNVGGWELVGGTSASAPLVAGILAHATQAVRDQGPEAFYRHRLTDVDIGGVRGLCKGSYYLCSPVNGYDGPTGWGTPNDALEATSNYEPATGPASEVTTKKATLTGWVNPEGLETTYRFEYGPTTSYGTSVPASGGSVGSGVLWKPVTQTLSLAYGTYHYRVIATNSSGTRYGKDETVTISPWVEADTTWLQNAEDERFTAVSCATTSTCMTIFSVVHEFNPFHEEQVLPWPAAERVNGTTWETPAYLPKPAGSLESGEIQGLSCPTTSACMAVGWYKPKSGGRSGLAETWNGSGWTVSSTATPPPEAVSVTLNAVSCSAANACMAVGHYYTSSLENKPLTELWNGEKWELKTPKLPAGAAEAILTGVSCPASANCTAVGFSCAKLCPKTTSLIEHWNGSSWEIENSPTPNEESNELYGVSCPTTSVCTAVGQSSFGAWQRTLAERLEDGQWSIQETPNPTNYSIMGNWECSNGRYCSAPVSCPSPTQCVATVEIPTYDEDWEGELGRRAQTAIWDGKEWRLQDAQEMLSPPGVQVASLAAVSCPAEGKCTAVGRANGVDTDFYIGGSGDPYEEMIAETLDLKLPTTELQPASNVGATEAQLNALVNPNGVDTKYQFEYGLITSYGHSAPISPQGIGAGSSGVKVNQVISELKPNTTYHFRVATSSEEWSTHSGDKTFTTGSFLHWHACTKQSGGKYTSSKCTAEGAPNEWESLLLKEAEKTTIAAKGNSIAFTSTQAGIKAVFSCETEVASPSLENPTGGGNGLGNAEVKYKGCKPEGYMAEKGCKVESTANYASKLEVLMLEGKAQVLLKPASGETFATFNVSSCTNGALNHSYILKGTLRGLYSNANSKIEFSTESTGESSLTLAGQKATAVGSIGLETTAGGYIAAGAEIHWFSCAKQSGGKYTSSKCTAEGAPNEWESTQLKAGEKTTIAAKGNSIAFTSTQAGIKAVFSCETEVASPSLENPTGGGNGLGNAEVKYKGCKPEGYMAEKGCKVENTANYASKLEAIWAEGKTPVLLKPSSGELLAKFNVSSCSNGALNGTYELKGTLRGLYSNANSKIEFSTESTGESSLTMRGQKATAVGSIGLETTAGGYIRAG